MTPTVFITINWLYLVYAYWFLLQLDFYSCLFKFYPTLSVCYLFTHIPFFNLYLQIRIYSVFLFSMMGCRSGEGAARALKGDRLPGAGTDHGMLAADFTYIVSQNTSIDLFYCSSINFELCYGTISRNKSTRKSTVCIGTLDLVMLNHYFFCTG